MTKRAAIALSGGMDSAVAAALLLKEGYRLEAWHMLLPLAAAEENAARARNMAAALGIPFFQLDLRQAFQEQILHYFISSYQMGLTPNPCILCNQKIKFGLLARMMRKSGADIVASGHYARVEQGSERPKLLRGRDLQKDQSYFLARLSRSQLTGVRMPLGRWLKREARAYGLALGLPLPEGESQDVCFLPAGLWAFLEKQGLSGVPGDIVDTRGRRLGRHAGLARYTVGQRRGLNLPDATPWYVVALDAEKNQVVAGKDDALFRRECRLEGLSWIAAPRPFPWRGLVQIRSRHLAAPAWVLPPEHGGCDAQLRFDTPERAITPGQFAVLYEAEQVVACATIAGPEPLLSRKTSMISA